MSKLEYANFLAASLAYLIAFQHDAVGLITLDDEVRDLVPPRQGAGHLRVLMDHLEAIQPGGETSLAGSFHQLAETLKRRSVVIIISTSENPTSMPEPSPSFRALIPAVYRSKPAARVNPHGRSGKYCAKACERAAETLSLASLHTQPAKRHRRVITEPSATTSCQRGPSPISSGPYPQGLSTNDHRPVIMSGVAGTMRGS